MDIESPGKVHTKKYGRPNFRITRCKFSDRFFRIQASYLVNFKEMKYNWATPNRIVEGKTLLVPVASYCGF